MKTQWANHQDVWVLQTRGARYVIRRDSRGSVDFRLWVNGKPTGDTGSPEDLRERVNQIIAIRGPKSEGGASREEEDD